MSQLTYFLQGCPTCGRASQVQMEYLGHMVSCRHCGGKFIASSEASESRDMTVDPVDKIDDAATNPSNKPR